MFTEKFLSDLNELVSIDCGSDNKEGVEQVADVITRHFKQMEMEGKTWFADRKSIHHECGPFLIFSNRKQAETYDVTLLCHMDTVYKPGICDQYPAYTDGDKYRGPGVSDMKSGCLAVIYALKLMAKEVFDSLSVCVCFTPDEEIGAPYSHSYIEEVAKRSKRVLVGEAARPDGSLLKARKGNGKIQVEFFGKAAHAGSALTEGVSAVTELAHWVHAINDLVDLKKGTTASVGIVEGGTGINVVPDYAKAMVDLRFLENSEGDRVLDYLHTLSEKPFLQGMKVKVQRLAGRPAFQVVDGAPELIELVKNSAQKLDIDINFITGGGASDGNIAAALGVPTIDGFGPCGGGFHNVKEEFVLISTIEPRVKLLTKVLEELGSDR
ncbi:M20 family metallopeptidase [Vibrio sp. JC009]|uniref:M20 family metallopeptidase n=1 Tax=Vibrio sp. JC009 TaxID=2912314 RepID=UPI0023B1F274|nr:M20 family metallopeptidase [Vibrio sp. JC009]WED22195.1 M20 family metallopeptidase [Vibrio sp. JC009]